MVLAIVVALSSLLFAGVGLVRAKADRMVAVQSMRTIGLAVIGYAADHDGILPGPLWPGQMPLFDPGREGRLVREIAAWVPLETPARPEVEPLFVPPAYRKAVRNAALKDARTFVMNMAVPVEGGTLNPWGSLAAGQGAGTARLNAIPASAWGFSDADREHPRVAGAPWANQTPAIPVHPPQRLAWFFDGRVGSIETAALK